MLVLLLQVSVTRVGETYLLVFVLLDQEARRFRKQEQTDADDDRPSELHRDRDPVGSGVVPVLGRVVHDGCQQQSNCDGELVRADNRASNPFGRSLGLVKRNHGGYQAYSEASEESSGDEHLLAASCDRLQDHTEVEDDGAGADDSPSATEVVCQWSGQQGSEEGAGRED